MLKQLHSVLAEAKLSVHSNFTESVDLVIKFNKACTPTSTLRVKVLGVLKAQRIGIIRSAKEMKGQRSLESMPFSLITEQHLSNIVTENYDALIASSRLEEGWELPADVSSKIILAKMPLKTATILVDKIIRTPIRKDGILTITIGKTTFPTAVLATNVQTIICQLMKLRQKDSKVRSYIEGIKISTTMGQSMMVDHRSLLL